jgi:hypothetical protein
VSEGKQPISDSKLAATAYHEAGHAVIALALGRAIDRVTVVPNQRFLGSCQLQKGRVKPTKDWLEDEILILLAGIVAESRFSGKYNPSGAAQDLTNTRRLSLMRAGGESQAVRLERRLLNKTEHLVDETANWLAIEAIAQQLLINHAISGRAARHHFELAAARAEKLS